MLSCKKCGAQMSGIDLVCKNCGTPWGKKHKSRFGIYVSIFVIALSGVVSYIYYTPGAKESFLASYNQIVANFTENKNLSNNEENKVEAIVPDTPSEPEIKVEEIPDPIPIKPEPPVEEKPILPPNFTWLSSSSALNSYPIELTVDGKLETAWLEGVKGNGIGEWIMYSAETDQLVSSITLYNGYLKNDKVYINNGKIKKLSIEFSDGEIITKDLPKAKFNDAKNGYVINLETPKITTSVKLTILDAYQGAYYTDTGISGIKFN